MKDLDALAFDALFREAHEKCFGHPFAGPLTETESKQFSNEIFEKTGLVIGAKSIKNYSTFISSSQGKQENPSVATLDTLARYALNAPYTDELERKNKGSHYPYWFQYRNQFQKPSLKTFPRKTLLIATVVSGIIIVAIVLLFSLPGKTNSDTFTDDFTSLKEDSLFSRGWFVQSRDDPSWKKRNEKAGFLTLFTLRGDNWPDSISAPVIQNLLVRKISGECFAAEAHLKDFFPRQNWQQAGILLMEDTNFSGKSLRLSIMYNDFFGGFPKSREIIIQAITSLGRRFDKPEEIAHQVIFTVDSKNAQLVALNLQNSALRIEKNHNQFKLLFSNGSMANSAFKELVTREFDMNPKYIGLFALKGFVDSSENIPARFRYFHLTTYSCK